MGKNFVLKNRMGNVVGYAAQGLGVLRCRYAEAKEGAKVVFRDKDGGFLERNLEPSGAENEWNDENKTIIGVAIVFENEILADTGYEMSDYRKKMVTPAKARPVLPELPDSNKGDSDHEAKRAAASEADERMPQRRWPPPPCMKNAVYRSGMWKEEA